MRWPWSRKQPEALISVSDPALAAYFGVGNPSYAGVSVGESSALGISAVYRAVSLIAGTIAGLPMRSMRTMEDGARVRVPSFLDDPGAVVGMTPYEWREACLAHLLLHGNCFLGHIRNAGGGLAGLVPIHPLQVTVDWQRDGEGKLTGRKVYDATLDDGSRRRYTDDTLTHVPAMSLDGLRGLSPIAVARNSLGAAIAGDRAAARMFSEGALISGMVTPEEDLEEGDAEKITADLNAKVTGWQNAAKVAVVNRKLKFTPWTMTMKDAEFLASRQFSIEEISRWYGIPPHLLGQTEKQTSWGTGVAEQNRGLARFTLAPWTSRIEARLSRLLPAPRFCEFDYAGLLQPSPEQEIPLLIQQVDAGLMTPNEARRIRGMDPIPGGDTLRGAREAPEPPEDEGAAE